MRKYIALICFDCFEDNTCPFFSSDNALILSWNTVHSSISYPWHSTKYLVQITSGNLSWRAINSVSLELLVLHFILLEELTTAPLLRVIRHPICPLQSSWTWCKASMCQYIAKIIASALKINFKCLVPLRYPSPHISLAQLSSLGSCTHVVRNDTANWMSYCALLAENKSWYVVWWNAYASSSLSFFPFSWILYKWSAAGVAHIPKISYGNHLWYILIHVDPYFVVGQLYSVQYKSIFWHAWQQSDTIRVIRPDRWVRSEVLSPSPHWDMMWQSHHIITTSSPGCRIVFLHRCSVLDRLNTSELMVISIDLFS